MKATFNNIVRLWFGADTPIHQRMIEQNPGLWAACQRVNQDFTSPSGALNQNHYRKSDKAAFARAVLDELQSKEMLVEEEYEWV